MSFKKTMVYAWNIISLIGFILVLVGGALIATFQAIEVMHEIHNPYIGILIYFIFPGILVTGLALVPIGIYFTRNRMRRDDPGGIPRYPTIDLNDPKKRKIAIFFTLATLLFAILITLSGIKGYEFTESVTFCGKLCHVAMEPEYVAWQHSPHAKVRCVECHVGPGAQWYVKAKISGTRQMFAVLLNTFERPISTPVQNLRPSSDTCEGCHWPDKFFSPRLKKFYHYAPNEKNTPRETDLVIFINGTPETPLEGGVHWHIGQEVTYIPRDKSRQDIPYITVKGKDGKVREYMTSEKPLTTEEVAKGEKRIMDCIDCHNRPTHIYKSPGQAIDAYLHAGSIDTALPYFKKVAVGLLTETTYKTTEEAMAAISKGVTEYYAKNYPEVAKQKGAQIQKAIAEIQDIYKKNFFPRMQVAWNTYPNNIGHFNFPGCFRCHDDKHKSADGHVIRKDCNLCHKVMREIQENIPAGTIVNTFVHPVDIGDEINKTNCSDCHQPPKVTHEEGKETKGTGAEKK